MLVDIEAVDTHRPKPSIKKKTSKQEINGTLKGASGEIAGDSSTPILPISPQLWPQSNNGSVQKGNMTDSVRN